MPRHHTTGHTEAANGPASFADTDPHPAAPSEPTEAVRLGEILTDLGLVGAAEVLLGVYEQDVGDPRRLGEILVAHGVATRTQVEVALRIQRGDRIDARDETGSVPSPQRDRFLESQSALDGVAARAADEGIRRVDNARAIAMFGTAVIAVGLITTASGGNGSWYGVGALLVLCIKLIGSVLYRPSRQPIPADVTVALVVCVYNEDPRAFLACLDSIIRQTHTPDEIWIIDDGSENDTCLQLALDAMQDQPGVVIRRLEANGGKRHAQSEAFRETTCDIIVTVDSDTVLDREAVAEGLRPLSDRRVNAVTGNVRALNYRKNLLTRLIDLRYANAFLFERGAYSAVGSVVCCCGSFSLFRTAPLRANLDDFVSQHFLGVPVQYGDDRRLTQYALGDGLVRMQDTAVAYTLVPEKLGHFRRQQLRWNKSFFRESLWAIRRFGPQRWPFWISLIELTVWFTFTASLLGALYIRPLTTGSLLPWEYIAFAVVLAYARNIRYFGRPGESAIGQALTFGMAPVYTLLHVVMLTPLRLWALFTMRRNDWGTRAHVEVRAQSPNSEASASRT